MSLTKDSKVVKIRYQLLNQRFISSDDDKVRSIEYGYDNAVFITQAQGNDTDKRIPTLF
ncbi:hypothetical protein [Companilactobacillus mishanensis]|uniref:hypothetical protein n=1 Tax=Companilactobacillus mishanensis TaxID=2486008 RepID=UPI0012950A42|nr:hypothetical protein [Companilactobacillus mishanensis]